MACQTPFLPPPQLTPVYVEVALDTVVVAIYNSKQSRMQPISSCFEKRVYSRALAVESRHWRAIPAATHRWALSNREVGLQTNLQRILMATCSVHIKAARHTASCMIKRESRLTVAVTSNDLQGRQVIGREGEQVRGWDGRASQEQERGCAAGYPAPAAEARGASQVAGRHCAGQTGRTRSDCTSSN